MNTWTQIYWKENHERNEELENKILQLYKEKVFEFSDEEWNKIFTAGYNKLDVAKLCCKHAVLSEITCYDRHIVVAWDENINEDDVQKILDEAYHQWVNIDENPEAEDWCCEEWMLENLNRIYHSDFILENKNMEGIYYKNTKFNFFVLYCGNAVEISNNDIFITY